MNQWSKLCSYNFTVTSGGSYIILKELDTQRESDTKTIEAQMLRSTPVNIKNGERELDNSYGGWTNASWYKEKCKKKDDQIRKCLNTNWLQSERFYDDSFVIPIDINTDGQQKDSSLLLQKRIKDRDVKRQRLESINYQKNKIKANVYESR